MHIGIFEAELGKLFRRFPAPFTKYNMHYQSNVSGRAYIEARGLFSVVESLIQPLLQFSQTVNTAAANLRPAFTFNPASE